MVGVVVTPAQSSFFAGELFSVTVTFTNTHSPDAPSPRPHTHKRGAHSISSAPLARPPTSPGPPSTPPVLQTPGFVRREEDASVRRGLVGKVQDELPQLLEQRRRRLLAKSLSVSIAAHEVEEAVGEAMVVPRGTARVSSPLTRTSTLSLGTAHPHARKASVLDGQAQVSLPTPASSVSTFSLALDPIVEGVLSPCPSTPFLASPTFEAPTVSAYPAARRPAQASLGLGHPSASSTELILYSYAQLKGTLALTPLPGPRTADQRQTLQAARAALLKRPILGGGRMDISSSLHRRRPTHNRTASFSGLLDLISPDSRPSTSTPRLASSPVGLGIGGMGISTTQEDDDIDSDVPLPTFQVQPAMLAVDLMLAPGQSRSYTYSILLPDVLPPTFKGRTLRFSYELEVGTCRAGPGSTSANSVSRVMKVPIRVYNNVVVGRTPRPYDMLWPLSKSATAPPPESQGKVIEETGKVVNRAGKSPIVPPQPALTPITGTYDDLQDYARRLLESFPDPRARGVRIKLPAEAVSQVPQSASPCLGAGAGAVGGWAEEGKRLEREMEKEMERAEGGMSGCREAVEVLTRNPKKASYDVNKDGVKVAVLTFAKGAYRLGETVVGVVEINERQSRARVVQLSAILEAHESLPSTLAPNTPTRQLKRVHAEHHAAHLLSTLRTTFTLDIPPDAAPAFQMCVGRDVPGAPVTKWGGLEWKVRLCLLVAVAGAGADGGGGQGGQGQEKGKGKGQDGAGAGWVGSEGVRVRGMRREGARGEWGSSWVATTGLAPMEKVVRAPRARRRRVQREERNPRTMGWGAFLAASLFGAGTGVGGDVGAGVGAEGGESEDEDEDEEEGDEEDEGEEEGYDGIKPDLAGGVGVGVSYGGGEEGWRDVKMETVECEVPVRMWPGNTAFKAVDIVFEV